MNNNDSRVIELKKQIETKKELMGRPYNPSFLTCCVLELDGITYNFNVASKDQLMHLAVKLELYKAQFNKMFTNEEYTINSFTVDNWLDDISNVLYKRRYKEELRFELYKNADKYRIDYFTG